MFFLAYHIFLRHSFRVSRSRSIWTILEPPRNLISDYEASFLAFLPAFGSWLRWVWEIASLMLFLLISLSLRADYNYGIYCTFVFYFLLPCNLAVLSNCRLSFLWVFSCMKPKNRILHVKSSVVKHQKRPQESIFC